MLRKLSEEIPAISRYLGKPNEESCAAIRDSGLFEQAHRVGGDEAQGGVDA